MRKKQQFQWDRMNVGTDYYPEHWDESLWEEDLNRMLANGVETIRMTFLMRSWRSRRKPE